MPEETRETGAGCRAGLLQSQRGRQCGTRVRGITVQRVRLGSHGPRVCRPVRDAALRGEEPFFVHRDLCTGITSRWARPPGMQVINGVFTAFNNQPVWESALRITPAESPAPSTHTRVPASLSTCSPVVLSGPCCSGSLLGFAQKPPCPGTPLSPGQQIGAVVRPVLSTRFWARPVQGAVGLCSGPAGPSRLSKAPRV